MRQAKIPLVCSPVAQYIPVFLNRGGTVANLQVGLKMT